MPNVARLRVIAANLSSGNLQSYTSGEGLRILSGLHPDIVLIQEFTYGSNTDAELQQFSDTAIGAPSFYAREVGAELPNAILSRYPIKTSGDWDDPLVTNRDFTWAQVDIPGDEDLWAVSVHLLTTSAGNRDGEAMALMALLAGVPSGNFRLVGGDLNTATPSEACLTTFSALLSVGPPYAVDQQGNSNTNGPRSRPHDWVMPDQAMQALATPVVIGANSFPDGLVFDSRVYTPLTDVAPIMMTDSGAPNMQHMAVVHDFAIPLGASGAGGTAGGGGNSGGAGNGAGGTAGGDAGAGGSAGSGGEGGISGTGGDAGMSGASGDAGMSGASGGGGVSGTGGASGVGGASGDGGAGG